MRKATFYVGSNNQTNCLEESKIHSALELYVDGYTFLRGKGYWKSVSEDSAVIIVWSTIPLLYLKAIASFLARELNQEAIGLEYENSLYFVGQDYNIEAA